MTTTPQSITYDQFFIGGEYVDPAGDGRIEVVNAATEEVIGHVPEGVPEDIERAVTAARAALDSWSRTPRQERIDLCTAIGQKLLERQEEIAVLITQEVGTPLAVSIPVQVGLPISNFLSMADAAEQVEWEKAMANSIITREPVGVVGAITPWNFPLHQITAKVAPAMVAGCTVVVKPSEVTPFNAFLLADIMQEVGVPAGVYNVVTGVGGVVGEALVAHEDVDMISFTGSTAAGRRISEVAARRVKRVALELGGKSPNVILDDADLEAAVANGITKCYLNSGQTCAALTRMLVPRDKLPEVERIAADVVSQWRVGDPFDENAALGPLVSETQRERVLGYIDKGIEEGAKLVVGGKERPEGLERGYYVQPTVFSEVTPEMTIAQEEIFGPVLVIQPYEDEEDAIRIANDTQYGLAAAVYGGDVERAKAIGRRLQAGQVEINGADFNPQAPFGGFKQSGTGRELGPFGIEEFTVLKSMQV